MSKSILATLLAVISLAGPATLSAEAKHCRGGWGNGYFNNYPGNSYFGHHHRRGNCGRGGWGYGAYNGYNGYGGYGGYGGRGTFIDRLVGNGYGRGYNY